MGWSFLTSHARVLLHITDHPDARIREIAVAVGITERTASSVLADLAAAGFIVKEREGRRNRYHVQDHLPLLAPIDGQARVVDMLRLLTEERGKTEARIFRERERMHGANVAGTALLHGGHDAEIPVTHDALDTQNDQLADALATRERISQAVGILIATTLCTPDEAFDLLVAQSQHEKRKVVLVAAEIVERAVSRATPRRQITTAP